MSAATKLQSLSWDFPDARTGDGAHGIHPYPAKFIPQIPRNLIKLFHPGDDSAILDVFCGSGTTLVEAAEAGLPSIGIDLHPLATLIAKVKTTPLNEKLASVATTVAAAARTRLAAGGLAIPPIPRIDHWFKRHVQEALTAILAELSEVNNQDAADALRVALSSIIVRVSNQESDTRYAAVQKDIQVETVFNAFERAAHLMGTALASVGTGLFAQRPRVSIVTKDLMMIQPDEVGKDIGLAITSPPYPNAYEYWLYHKYRMYWLGMDPIAVRQAEIGARAHYFKKNHPTELDFEKQMQRCFWLLASVMRQRAYAFFVVGRSIIHGREIDNEAVLTRAAAAHGFQKAASIERKIALTRKSFNLAHGTINRERIVAFVLEGE
ncbi:MAG TPA: DNA methyltransferase [Gemmataceae bacterium]|nr:DNA methyltransferase [Gemmataceae bacterium]